LTDTRDTAKELIVCAPDRTGLQGSL